jgi:hypothetical protein
VHTGFEGAAILRIARERLTEIDAESQSFKHMVLRSILETYDPIVWVVTWGRTAIVAS